VTDLDPVAGVPEELEDVRRIVREEVARVRVLPPRNAIDDSAPVGVDEAADQLARVGLDESNLPVLQDDRTAVLPPWPVLGKDAGPVLPIAVDLHAPRPLNRSSPSVPSSHSIDRSLSQPDQLGISNVLDDAEPICSGIPRDVPVPKVETEQICVGRFVDGCLVTSGAPSDPARP
jgi:hypothetical protein